MQALAEDSAVDAPTAAAPSVRVGSGIITILLSGEATGGAYAFFEEVTDPGEGTPLHVHEREDEAFFILEGQFEFRLGEKTLTAGPGDFVHAPRGVPHTFRNLSSGPARKLALAWPAGVDRFFLEVGQPVGAAAEESPASPPNAYAAVRFAEALTKYGMRIIAPPT